MFMIMVTNPVRETDHFVFFVRFLMRLIVRMFFRFCLHTENKEKNENIIKSG